MFELQMFSTDLKFDECFKHFGVECEFVENPCSMTDFICIESQKAQTNLFFLKFSLSHTLQLLNVQHDFCSVMCCTVLISTLILLTSGNNIC